MILQIHDELVFEMPEEDAQINAQWIAVAMTSAIQLNVPLKVDIAIGNSWLE
jgi:DNA polymerase-1